MHNKRPTGLILFLIILNFMFTLSAAAQTIPAPAGSVAEKKTAVEKTIDEKITGQITDAKKELPRLFEESEEDLLPKPPGPRVEEAKIDDPGNADYDVYRGVVEDYRKKEFVTKYTKSFTAREYVLGPNDIITISVNNVPELTQSRLQVNPEGKVNICYMGNTRVAGLKISELQRIIEHHYREYIINPEVIINIDQNRPFIFYVSGAVRNPGGYEINTMPNLSPYLTKPEAYIERKTPLLSNVLVAAGGIAYDADIEHVRISNELDGSVFEVNLYNLINESDFAQDFYLIAGDKIYVPRLPSPAAIDNEKYRLLCRSTIFQKTIPVRVIGYVNRPGLVTLESDQSSNLNSAIAAAGGYITNYGDYPKEVRISRLDNNNKLVTISVNPLRDDIAIMPNDIIYVPEKKLPLAAKLFDYTIRLMNPFAVFSNTYQSWDNMLD